MSEPSTPRLVNPDGTYPCKPLEKEVISLAVIQSNCCQVMGIPPSKLNKDEILTKNIDKMLSLAEDACQDSTPDIMLFHEFPITGFLAGPGWDRATKLEWAIEIPGPYTSKLCALAKEKDMYVIFGSYAKDPVDWPGHVLSIQTVIGRDGVIQKQIWKPKNIMRYYPGSELTTTTVSSVRTKFREMYGVENEFPVLQTEFGNIAVCTVQLDPFVYAAYAMKGTELMLRTSTLFYREDVISTALTYNMYSAMANIPYGRMPFAEYGGHSMVCSPKGKVMDEVTSCSDEGFIKVDIPIAEYRKERKQPQCAMALTKDIFDQYVEEVPIDHLLEADVENRAEGDACQDCLDGKKLPNDGKEMKVLIDQKSRWISEE